MNWNGWKKRLITVLISCVACHAGSTIASETKPVKDGATPSSVANTFVYVADFQPTGFAQYRLGVDGALLPLQPPRAPVGKNVQRIVPDRAGRYAYTLNRQDNTISHCLIRKDGTIVPRPIPDVKSGKDPDSFFLDEAKGLAYATSMGEPRLYRFALDGNGVLKPLPSLEIKGAGRVIAFFGPNRDTLFVGYALQKDYDALKKEYEALKDKSGFDETKIPVYYETYRPRGTKLPKRVGRLVVQGGNLGFEPKGRFAYIPRRDIIGCYRVRSNGTLDFTGDVEIPTGRRTVGIRFDLLGRFAYVHHYINGRSVLSQFRLDEKGLLVPLTPQYVPVEGDLVNETLDPTGRFFYATSVHTGNTMNRFVVPFRIGQDGRLQRIKQKRVETGNNAGLPEFDPTGRFAYIGTMVSIKSRDFYDVLSFRVGPDGALTPLRPAKTRMNYFWGMRFVQQTQEAARTGPAAALPDKQR